MADVLTRRQSAALKLFLDSLFDDAYLTLLSNVNDADAGSLLAGTASTATSMSVVLGIVGQTIVDNMCEIVNIKSACCYIGSHKQLCAMLAEFLHREVALLLGEIAMQGIGIVTILYQFVGNLLSFHTGATEDNAIDAGIVVNDTLQCKIFILRAYHIIYMIYMLGTLIARPDLYFLGVL